MKAKSKPRNIPFRAFEDRAIQVTGETFTLPGGGSITGVRKATVQLALDQPITANLEILVAKVDIKARSLFKAADPATGVVKPVSVISFLDRSMFTSRDATVHLKSGPIGFGVSLAYVDGTPVKGIRKASVHMNVAITPVAELEILTTTTSSEASYPFAAADPATGDVKPVHSIHFADGSTFVVPCSTCGAPASPGAHWGTIEVSSLGSGRDKRFQTTTRHPVCDGCKKRPELA